MKLILFSITRDFLIILFVFIIFYFTCVYFLIFKNYTYIYTYTLSIVLNSINVSQFLTRFPTTSRFRSHYN